MKDSQPPRGSRIVAPVSRLIEVADLAFSTAYYRDVLGFAHRGTHEARGQPATVELTLGPARLQLRASRTAASAARAVVFFTTDDVVTLRASLTARGAIASEIADANGIKMRVFEVRDPNGHVLWFGESFDRPDAPPPVARLLQKALPELPLDDVARGIAYYRDVLGFSINHQQHDLGVLDRDDVRVLLVARTARHKGIGSVYVYVRDADALHAELTSKGARVAGEPVSQSWGLREFPVLDPEGNEIKFGQPFE